MQWNTIKNFIIHNSQWILYFTIACFLVLGTAAFISEKNARTEQAALDALFQAQLQLQATKEKPNFDKAKASLEPMIAKYSGTRAAYEALMNLGDQAMAAKSYDAAIDVFSRAVKVKVDAFSHLLALYSLGIAQESKGNYEQAQTSFDQALNIKEVQFMKAELMLAKARCLDMLRKYDDANTLYQDIKAEFPDNNYYNGAASIFAAELKLKMNHNEHATK